MELSIHPGLYAMLIKAIEPAIKPTSRTGKYETIKVESDSVSVSVIREDLIARATVESKKVADPQLLNLIGPGFVVVNGGANSQFVLKSHSQAAISAKFEAKKATKVAAKTDDSDTDEVLEEIGVFSYRLVGATNKKWKLGLQCVNLPECDVAVDLGDKKAEISGPDLQKYAKFVGAYGGKGTMSTNWSNALLSMKGDTVEFVTTNGQQIGVARFRPTQSGSNFEAIISCDAFAEAVKMMSDESPVSIYVKSGSPAFVSFVQRLTFGNGDVGSLVVRVPTSADKFHNFRGPIEKLLFKSIIKAKTQQLRNICDMLDCIGSRVKTKAVLDIAKMQVAFFKQGEEGFIEAEEEGLALPLIDGSKGDNVELDLSSRHLRLMADQTEKEDLMVEFSGKTTMGRATLDDNRMVYFIPFRDAQ